MKLAVLFFVCAMSACASVEVERPADRVQREVRAFGPWVFGMSRAEVARYQNIDEYLSQDEQVLFEQRDTAKFEFVFDEHDRLDRITLWLASEEGDKERLVRSWSRVFAYLDRRGGGVVIPKMEIKGDIQLDEALIREVYRGIVADLSAELEKRSNEDYFSEILMYPRAAVPDLALEGKMVLTSRKGGMVGLVIAPRTPSESRWDAPRGASAR